MADEENLKETANEVKQEVGEEVAKRPNLTTWLLIGVPLLLLLLWGVSALGDQVNTPQDSQLESLSENPEDYYGRNISISGEVDDVKGSRSFTLDTPGVFNDQLLVISRDPLVPVGGDEDDIIFNNQDRVRVSGMVQPFDLRTFEEQLGVDLVDDEFADWQGQPAIIAEDVAIDQ